MPKWKPYLIRRVIQCRKCKKESAEIYQFLPGGLIHARCSVCGADNRFNMTEFRSLPPFLCPKCNKKMKPEQKGGNAYYICEGCDLDILLADILPNRCDLIWTSATEGMIYGYRRGQSFIDFLALFIRCHLYQPTFSFPQKAKGILPFPVPKMGQFHCRTSRQNNGNGDLLFNGIFGIFVN